MYGQLMGRGILCDVYHQTLKSDETIVIGEGGPGAI